MPNLEDLMRDDWFPQSTPFAERPHFDETTIRDIAAILRNAGHESWCRIPRIYIILRSIDRLSLIDDFANDGLTDLWFPFKPRTLPSWVDHETRRCFLDAQHLVFTKSLDLEKENGEHRHFQDPKDLPFIQLLELGRGGFGVVDKVQSTISHKEYARKCISRGLTFRKDKRVLEDFENELVAMKRLRHRHIVKFVGSYTDPTYVCIIMSPVADCDLQLFMSKPASPERDSLLRTSLGCLTEAITYLHHERIRHKDIKPTNIVVKNHQVFVTDFGISRDWREAGRSTTTGPTVKTEKYCAPEVATLNARNTSADIWSLGCVFLEIWTVLCGATLEQLDQHMRVNGSRSTNYHTNIEGLNMWSEILISGITIFELKRPAIWISWMLKTEPGQRCTALALLEAIMPAENENTTRRQPYHFVGVCCLPQHGVQESVASSLPTMERSNHPPSHRYSTDTGQPTPRSSAPTTATSLSSSPADVDYFTTDTASPWTIDSRTRSEFNRVFRSIADADGELVSRQQAMELFSETGLRQKEVEYICSLVGLPGQESFNSDEFAVAMRILDCRRVGMPIPSRVPAELQAVLNADFSRGRFPARSSPAASSALTSLSETDRLGTQLAHSGSRSPQPRIDIAKSRPRLPNLQAMANKYYNTKLPLIPEGSQKLEEDEFKEKAEGRLSVRASSFFTRPTLEDLHRARYCYPANLISKFEIIAQIGASRMEKILFSKREAARFTFFEYCLWAPFHSGGETSRRPAFLIDFLHWAIDDMLGLHPFGEENPIREPVVKAVLVVRWPEVPEAEWIITLPLAFFHPSRVAAELKHQVSLHANKASGRLKDNFRVGFEMRDADSHGRYEAFSPSLNHHLHRLHMNAAFGRDFAIRATVH